ncbi:peroxiredoxin type-2 [Tilletia horrida]|uniref:Putative peroxiredoxin n=1 Tax=Tilletia horrida TaxID=155126 RepID=A0AAN6JPF1_9BASI|nr:peroxiredoxin type-2 [Tilletia horrida]KAK0525923.1 peroxiredoxin type-2 [Tilletia horrida]KAK0526418.1 peroxiredoxin type-2 [Tilletia horrida]
MSSKVVGTTIPDVQLPVIYWSPELESGESCGIVAKLSTHKEFKGKKVVIVAAPGAFTPTCHLNHIPPFIQKVKELKSKGVDQVIVLTANDAFVQAAWGRHLGAKDAVLFVADPNLEFSAPLEATLDLTGAGLGKRTARYAAIVDDLKITYFEIEQGKDLEVSSVEAVLSHL